MVIRNKVTFALTLNKKVLETTQLLKALASVPDNLRLLPRTHEDEGENQLQQVVL